MSGELVGSKIQSYRIIRQIGRGGMGNVYEARHEQIERRAAIKVLHPEYARDAEMAQRFFNEARAANVVGHPGLVSIYELGTLETGAAYIIMEYLEGDSLRQRIRRPGGCPEVEALRIARQIAGALQAVHAKGIIHRELSPRRAPRSSSSAPSRAAEELSPRAGFAGAAPGKVSLSLTRADQEWLEVENSG